MPLRPDKRLSVFAVAMIGFCLSLIGCAAPTSPKPPEPAAEKDVFSVYATEIQPLSSEDCGRCHPHFYDLIRNDGGKHRIGCTECHVEFHIYRPGKMQYEQILPKCDACHDQVHGEDLAQCSGCHSEVHTPMNIPAERTLEQGCHICHPELDKEMKTYITQHTELYCSSCHHTRHGYVPECLECHQPHEKWMTQADCLTCHPPHKALEVVYPEDVSPEICAGCHRNAYEALKQSGTKHSAVTCVSCHPEKHRAIKRCQECHPESHSVAVLGKFRVCGQCHGAAHNLLQ